MGFAAYSPLMPLSSAAANIDYERLRRARPLLGTIVEIEVGAHRTRNALHAAIDEAFRIIEQVHALMSYQEADSELSMLNRSAANDAQRVDPRTYRVLQAALQIARLSRGAFDPCVLDKTTTWRDIQLLDGERVRYTKPLRVDLGGIAKGFAVDEAVERLKILGMDDICVNAGGDLCVAGAQAHSVMLRDPTAPTQPGHTLMLQNAAIATSAAYYSLRTLQGERTAALIDGRTREYYSGGRSVSVRSSSCMRADALTKVVLFADRAVSEFCLARFDAQAYVLE
jgi:FAD:protein FMN transferase